jgi:glycosyltransferase involved in cell wall biosynthesis
LAELIPGRHEWYLYSDSPFESTLSSLPNVVVRFGKAKPSSLAGMYYSQALYRSWSRRDQVELFWSPRHHLPVALDERIPQVVTIHDLVWKRFPETMPWQARMLESVLMPVALRQAATIVCVSNFTASEVAHFWPQYEDKCVVVRSAATRLNSVDEDSPAGMQPYILFVGTLEPRKNLRRLLRAFSTLVHENRIVENLVIAGGEGWGEVELAPLIKGLGIDARAFQTGRMNDAQLGRLYRGARCLVMPSLYEGFGLPVLEAMQYGVPAVVSGGGALQEIAGSGALFVDPASEQSIAQAIELLMTDSRLHSKLSMMARSQAAQFSWGESAEQLLGLFEAASSVDKAQ